MSEYIERGALSKFVRDVRKRLPKDSKDFFTRDEMLLNFQQYVDAQAAADVEPVVRGEWKDRCVRDWVCSSCGCEIQKVRFYDGYRYTSLPNFCPDCGAAMTEAAIKKIMERSGSGETD